MKKIILFIATVFLLNNANAQEQKITVKPIKGSHYATVPHASSRNNYRAATATPFYTQNFANGIPANWTVEDLAGNGEIWTYTSTGPLNNPTDALQSVTASNGYMIMNDDSYTNYGTVANTNLISNYIHCDSLSNVHIAFTDFFRQNVNGLGVLYVSNDGTTWHDVYHAETGLDTGLFNGDATSNPHHADIDISQYTNNKDSILIKFNYQGDWDYYWEIDDIEFYEGAAIDGGAVSITTPTGCNLSANAIISVDIKNSGATPLTNFPVSIALNGATAITETVLDTINPGNTFTYQFQNTFYLDTAGTYSVQAYTGIASDGNHNNDSLTQAFTLSAYNNLSSNLIMGFQPSQDFSNWLIADNNGDGNTWSIIDNASSSIPAHSGDTCLRRGVSSSADNDWLFTPCLHLQTGTTYVLDYWYLNFDLQNASSLEVKYGINQTESSMTNTIVNEVPDSNWHHSYNGFTVPSSGVYYIGFRSYSNAGSSSIRLDDISISIYTGINQIINKTSFHLYPNPTYGKVTIANRDVETTLMSIYNIVGEKVFSQQLNAAETIVDLSELSNGVYVVKFDSAQKSFAQKLIINR